MNWIKDCRKQALALPLETRQKFIDLMWSGSSLGEAQKACLITFEAANGIMNINIDQATYLRRESV